MFYRVSLLLLAACLWSGTQQLCLAQSSPPPNIVFILGDDQAWTDYGFMGHPVIKTPNLDRLASKSAVFRRGYVPTALCRPSLATLATGLYAHQHQITGNDPSPELAPPNSPEYAKLREALISKVDRIQTLPKMLGAKGYLSHQSGKWWEGSFQRGGFTHGMTEGFPANREGRHGDKGLVIGREGLKPVLEFIDHSVSSQKPFYVWYAPFLPHTPHNPPERILAKYKDKVESPHIAKYYAMCEWFDETVGELVGAVEQRGLASNTIFVYICDNGWIQLPNAPGYAPRSKQSPYDGGVRQPILIRWDGMVKHKDYDDLVSSIDIVPTLLSAAGVSVPKELPGLDLLPLIRDGKPLQREMIFGEGFSHDIMDPDDPDKTLLYRWVIHGKWKLMLTYDGHVGKRYASSHPRDVRTPQLFDILNDPHERVDLAKQYEEVTASLSSAIALSLRDRQQPK